MSSQRLTDGMGVLSSILIAAHSEDYNRSILAQSIHCLYSLVYPRREYILRAGRLNIKVRQMNHHHGHLSLIFGPMFSGKSSELQRMVRRYEISKKKCLVINYALDCRYSTEEVVSTHDR